MGEGWCAGAADLTLCNHTCQRVQTRPEPSPSDTVLNARWLLCEPSVTVTDTETIS